MWEVSQIICIGTLAGMSVTDIKFRKIPVDILVMGGIGAILYHFIAQEMGWSLIAGGIGVGLLFLLISKVTGESMGYGDSWSVLILGIYLGLWGVIEVLTAAFCILAAVGILSLMFSKLSRKSTLPFLPFLTGGYLVCLLCQGGLL